MRLARMHVASKVSCDKVMVPALWCSALVGIIPGAWLILPLYVARRLLTPNLTFKTRLGHPSRRNGLPGFHSKRSMLLETHPRGIIGQFSCARHPSV
jgi:hypothetical protein